MSQKVWVEKLNMVIDYSARKGWRASLMKLAFVETIYGLWIHQNEIIFGKTIHRNTTYSIIETIVNRGW